VYPKKEIDRDCVRSNLRNWPEKSLSLSLSLSFSLFLRLNDISEYTDGVLFPEAHKDLVGKEVL